MDSSGSARLPRVPAVWMRSAVRTPRFRAAALALALVLSSGTLSAQDAASPAPCPPGTLSGLSTAHIALLTRASLDPIVGCGVLNAVHRTGDQTVALRDTVRGTLVVLDGTLRISGTILGTAIVLNGAVIVDSSARVTGDVIAAEHGAAIAAAGRIDGELRTLDAIAPISPGTPVTAVGSVLADLKQTAAWFGILILLAIGVLTNAGDAMQRVNAALKSGFGQNVVVGLMAQLALLPILATICLMLTLTLIGILLVPFAIVAYVIAVLGLIVLGGLGAIQMLGAGVIARRPGVTDRAARLQALVTGMLLISLPWLAAAALASSPVAAAWVRTLALGITWVAATAGLGAALRTRGGTRSHEDPWGIRRPAPSGTPLPIEAPKAEWLTPTPLTGVVAVKRPTTSTGGSR